jgi:hypothetical protein
MNHNNNHGIQQHDIFCRDDIIEQFSLHRTPVQAKPVPAHVGGNDILSHIKDIELVHKQLKIKK